MTEKQEIYKNYLLERMGYTVDDFLRKYISYKRDPVTALQIEYQFRLKKPFVYKSSNSYISATDISNFTFCPVAFAIQRTFELPKPKSADIGSELHEKMRLLGYLRPATETPGETRKGHTPSFDFRNEDALSFIDYFRHSVNVFAGHGDNGKQAIYFKSRRGNYAGQPDYIFHNTKDNIDFAVEEKFVYGGDDYSNKEVFFKENHRNQLRSYLYGIDEYDLKFGYLVYWVYKSDYSKAIVHEIRECRVLKITKTDSERNKLIAVYTSLKLALKQSGGIFYSQQRNANKCANCVVSEYCVHKSGNYEKYAIPYSTDHYSLSDVEYPKALIRLDDADSLTDLKNQWNDVRIRILKRAFYGFCKKFKCKYDKQAVDLLRYGFVVELDDKLYFKMNAVYTETNEELEPLKSLIGQTVFADWVDGVFEGYRNTGVVEHEKHMYFKTIYTIEHGLVKHVTAKPSDKLYR